VVITGTQACTAITRRKPCIHGPGRASFAGKIVPFVAGQAVRAFIQMPSVTVQIDLLIFAQSVIKITYFLWE